MTTQFQSLWPLTDYQARLELEAYQSRIDARRLAKARRQRRTDHAVCVALWLFAVVILGVVMYGAQVA